MDIRHLTGIENHTAAYHAVYTNAALMAAWLAAPETPRDRLDRAYRCNRTARRPESRFGLDTVPAEVVAVIKAAIDELEREIRPVVDRLVGFRKEGLAWDECWSFLGLDGFPTMGFGPGDARLLGVQ